MEDMDDLQGRREIFGSITALITPMQDGKVDLDAFRKLVHWQFVQGSHGLVAGGTTGEGALLSDGEMQSLFEIAVDQAGAHIPIIAGTGAGSTDHTIHLTQIAQDAGIDAALIVAPYYMRPSQDGIYQHYKAVHDATDIPILLYNVPIRTGVDILPETVQRLAQDCPRIIGIKEAGSDPTRLVDFGKIRSGQFTVLCGDDALTLPHLAMGARGCISVTANVAPKLCADLMREWYRGNLAGAQHLNTHLMPLHKALFVENSPSPVKYAASLLGLCADELRLPMVPVKPASRDAVASALHSAGLWRPAPRLSVGFRAAAPI